MTVDSSYRLEWRCSTAPIPCAHALLHAQVYAAGKGSHSERSTEPGSAAQIQYRSGVLVQRPVSVGSVRRTLALHVLNRTRAQLVEMVSAFVVLQEANEGGQRAGQLDLSRGRVL